MALVGLSSDQQREYDDFIQRNPGDEDRAASALGFSGSDQTGGGSYQPAPTSTALPQPDRQQPTYNPGGNDSGGGDYTDSGRVVQAVGSYNTGREDVDAMINRDWQSWEQRLKESAARSGVGYSNELQDAIRNISYHQNQGTDPDEILKQIEARYRERGSNVPINPGGNGGPSGGSGTRGGSGGPSQSLGFDQAQFDDPITRIIEQFARMRAQERASPSQGSGQALLEEALKNISQQFQSGGYTPAEQEIYQTQSLDPLERLRTARKQQVMQQLATRGIPMTSGVAQQMLQDVDRQFDAQRTTTQANLAGQFGNERVSRMLQGTQMLGQLAGTQNDRLNEAFQYTTVPMNLADRAFGQSMQVFNAAEGSANNAYNRMQGTYNSAGNPLNIAPSMLQLQQLQQNRGDNFQETLGYLLALLSQGQR